MTCFSIRVNIKSLDIFFFPLGALFLFKVQVKVLLFYTLKALTRSLIHVFFSMQSYNINLAAFDHFYCCNFTLFALYQTIAFHFINLFTVSYLCLPKMNILEQATRKKSASGTQWANKCLGLKFLLFTHDEHGAPRLKGH